MHDGQLLSFVLSIFWVRVIDDDIFLDGENNKFVWAEQDLTANNFRGFYKATPRKQ